MRETTFALKEFTVRWVLSSFIHSRGLNPHFAGCHKATSLALTSPLGATAACPVSYWSPLYGCSDDILNSLHLKLVHNHLFHPNSFSSPCLFSQWLYLFPVTQVLIFGGSNQTPDMTVTSPLLSIPLLLFWSLVHWSHCLWTTPMLRVTGCMNPCKTAVAQWDTLYLWEGRRTILFSLSQPGLGLSLSFVLLNAHA